MLSKVAVVDSGVGGLSIYQEIVLSCPLAQCIFISDNDAYPYGIKADTELLQRVLSVSEAVVRRHQPDVLVMACNTASTVCLPHLRERYRFPVVGVVPAIKPAALISRSNVIGLLATPATIKRPYTDSLISDFADGFVVHKVGSKELVDLAERKLRNESVDLMALKTILAPFLAQPKLDTLVLACTHFPLLKQEIQAVFNQHQQAVELVDSGAAVAKRVRTLLNPSSSLCEHKLDSAVTLINPALEHRAVFTKTLSSEPLIKNLKSLGFSAIETLTI